MAEQQKTKMRLPKGARYKEPKSRAVIGWVPEKVRQAERLADGGNLRLAADLVQSMLGDDRLRDVADTLGGIGALDMTFESGMRKKEGQAEPSDNDPIVQALADGDWWKMLPEATQSEIVVWARLLGVFVCCIKAWTIDPDSGNAVPELDVWSPRWAKWSDEEQLWEIETSDGKVKTNGADGTWLIACCYSTKRGWMVAPWRGLGRLWLIKQFALIDWPDDGDKNAQAKKVLKRTDYTVGDTGELVCAMLDDAERTKLVNEIYDLGRSGVYAPPDGYDLALLESSGRSAEVYEKQAQFANTAFAITLLGQNLATEVKAGAYASTGIHYLVQNDRLRLVAEWLSTVCHDKLLPWYRLLNWGESYAVPWARYDTTPPADEKAEAERFKTISEAVNAFVMANVPLDLTALKEQYGLPIDLAAAAAVQQRKLYQYHLTFGLVTKNEIRTKWLGLDKMAGGDIVPVPVAATPADMTALAALVADSQAMLDRGVDDQEGTLRKAVTESQAVLLRAMALRAQQESDEELDAGVDYLDRLEEAAKAKAGKLLRPGIDALLELVKAAGAETAETEEQRKEVLKKLRRAVIDTYDDMDPVSLSDTLYRVEQMASMAGARSALGEL